MSWKAYLKQTLIVGTAIGLVYTPLHAWINSGWHWYFLLTCPLGFITAIVLVDFLKGQKVFQR